MKKEMKLLLCGLVMIFLVSGCTAKEKNVQTPEPTKQPGTSIIDTKSNELSISDLTISYDEKEGLSTVVANVKNDSENDITLNSLTITLLDKDENKLVDTVVDMGSSIQKGQTKSFTAIITKDVRNATNIEYTINR